MTPGVVLSVVVPAHDEAANLARLLEEVRAALEPSGLVWELIVVDDCSTDESPAVLTRLAAGEPRLRPVRLTRRSGQTAALRAGFDAARGTLIATLDADLQCAPADLPTLIASLDGAALACGVRATRRDPPARRLASALANAVRRLFLAPRLRDLACPLRVFRAEALHRVAARQLLFDGAHRWLPALFHLAGERVVQRPVGHHARTAGASKYTTRGRIVPIATELVQVVGRSRRGRLLAAAGLAVAVALPFFWGLGRWPLLEPDEARNAEVAREMVTLGRWSVPHFNGLPYLDKPVLFFWMMAVGFRALGTDELAARLPAALAAFATVGLTLAIGRLLFGRSRQALLGALVVASTPLVLAFGRLAIFDMPFTALVTGALYCLLRARLRGAERLWTPVAGLLIGLAALTKGPVGVAVPLLAWVAGRGALPAAARRTSPGTVAATVAAAVLVIAPWLVTIVREEPGFLRYALLDETLLRFASVARFHRGAPVYYYAGVLGWGLGAWAVVLTVALPGLARRLRQGGPERAAIAFLARASAGILLFFTICASKRPAYILPAVVPLGLLAAAGIVAEEARVAAAVRALGALAALAGLAAVGVGLMRLLPESRVLVALTPVVLGRAGIVLLAWGGVALVAAAVRPALAAATCALLAPAMGLVLLGPLGTYAEGRSSRALAARIEPGAPVMCFQTFRTGLPFYLGRPVVLASERGSEMTSNYVVARGDRHGRVIVSERTAVAALDRGGPLYTVASAWSLRRLATLTWRRLVPVYADRRSILLRAEG